MKEINNHISALTLLIIVFIAISGCEEDSFSFPASEPLINTTAAFSTLPGGSINITASVTDPVGLQSVGVSYEAWSIAETNSLSGETEYVFSTTVNVPVSAEMGSVHELLLSAINANGVEKLDTLTVTLDEDAIVPVITINTPAGVAFLGDGSDATIDISVSDDVSIESFTISGSNITEKIRVGATKYNYTQDVNFQVEGVYEFEIEVVDGGGNVATATLNIPAFEPFESMYIADVDTDAELISDVMGVPLLANGFTQEDSLGKVFQAHYYSSTPNTEVRFTSSKETFGSLTLGADGQGNLLADNSASVSPLVLTEAGYHQITIDTRNLTYTTETYTPTDATFDLIIMMGTGVRVDGASTCESNADGAEACWWFGSGKELTVDPNNPYRFTATVELFDHDPTGDGNNGFILGANLSGWSPFWRFDDGTNPNVAVPNAGISYVFDESKYGTYSVVFDTHLNQFIMIRN